ncbi:MAG: hypothetical protein MJB14_07725, partial [Spirochaetes bacterium]|nr:hypothetical protein [Spirochaetota bacterium]
MKKHIYLFFILLLFICSCSSVEHPHPDIEWKVKTPMEVHYLFSVNNEIYCFSINQGFFKISKDGKIEKVKKFSKSDERLKLSNIKAIPETGVFGILKEKEEEKYIVEIQSDFKITRMLKVPEECVGNEDFLITKDRSRYCGFEN